MPINICLKHFLKIGDNRNAMKVLLLISFLAAANAASIFGSERCTWGPAYWCDHPLKAKECGEGAVQYCIENDWAELTIKNETLCDDCKTLVDNFKNALNSGEVQNDISKVLKELCDKLGSKATTCKLIVDLYGKDFLEKLVTKLNPSKVCTLLELCKEATPTSNEPAIMLLPQIQADPCADCKQIFADLKDILNNKTVQQFVFNELIMVCQELGFSESDCKSIIDQYGPKIFQYILQYLNGDEICKGLGICPSLNKFTFLRKSPANKVSNDLCSDCKQAIGDIRDMLSNKTLQQDIFNIAIEVCELAGLSEATCKSYVDQYGQEIFNELIQLMDPNTICQALGVCQGSLLNLPVIIQNEDVQETGDICKECKEAVDDLKDILSNTAIQKNILATAEKLCEALGISAASCQSAIGQYGQIILDLLVGELDGDALCAEQHFCAAAGMRLSHVVAYLKQIVKSSGDPCAECKKMLADISDILNNKTGQQIVFKELIAVCEALGIPSASCTSSIDDYGPLIISLITGYLTPSTCTSLNLCSSTTTYIQPAVLPVVEDVQVTGDICKECKEAVNDLKDILSNTAVQKNILDTVEKECEALGISAASCQSAISQYGQIILDLLVGILDGDALCAEQHFCAAAGMRLSHVVAYLKQIVTSSGDPCAECKKMLADISDILNNKTGQQIIFKELIAVCEALGIPSASCTSSIDDYGPLIISLITGYLTPSTCVSLNLCSSTTTYIQPAVLPVVEDVQVTGDICKECKEAVNDLKDILSNTAVQKNILDTVEKECEALGISAASCQSAISQYGQIILDLIVGILDGDALCAEQHFCATAGMRLSHVVAYLKQIVTSSGDPCAECKKMLGDISDILNNKTGQQIVFKELIAVCEALGIPSASCTSSIDDYGPLIISLITGYLTPSTCVSLNLCSSTTTYIQPAVLPVVEDVQVTGDICKECKEAVDDLKDILSNTAVQKNILDTVEKECEALGISAASCQSAISQYGQIILDLIVGILDGDALCAEQHFCATAGMRLSHVVAYLKQIVTSSGDPCAECKKMLADISDILNNKTGQQIVFKELIAVCEALGIPSASCTSSIDDYGPLIISLITGYLTPSTCTSLNLCTSATTYIQPAVLPVVEDVEVTGDVCKECKEAVYDLKDILSNTIIQKNILAAVEKLCESFGVPAASCQSAIGQYGQIILDLLVGELDGDALCAEQHFCATAGIRLGHVVAYLKQIVKSSGDPCVDCKQMFADITDILYNQTGRGIIFNELIAVCEDFGISSASCTNIINDYGPFYIGIILGYLTPSTCSALHLCPAMTTYIQPNLASYYMDIPKAAGDPCKECREAVSDLRDILSNSTEQKNILDTVEKVCEALGVPPDSCKGAVSQYGPLILNAIVGGLDSHGVCSGSGLCPAGSQLKKVLRSLKQLANAEGDMCVECKQMFVDLADILGTQSVQQVIFKELIAVCEALGISSASCTSSIDNYGPLIISLITGYMTPSTCSSLKLCPQMMTYIGPVPISVATKANGGETCAECKQLVADLLDLLTNGTIQNRIFKEIITICTDLGIDPNTCSDTVAHYGPIVMIAITNKLTPSLCTDAKLCSSRMPKQISAAHLLPARPVADVSIMTGVGDQQTCFVCELLMDALQAMYPKGASPETLKQAMNTICSLVGDVTAKKICTDFVNKYGDAAIKALPKLNNDYNKVCAYIKVCPSSDVSIMTGVGDQQTCFVCELLMDALQAMYPKGASPDTLKQAMNTICSLVGDVTAKKICTDFVNKYGDAVIKALPKLNNDYSKVCAYIKVCSSSEVDQEKIPFSVGDIFDCVECIIIKGYLVQVIKPGVTKAQVNAALNAVCMLIGTNEAQCRVFIGKYRANITQYLLSGKRVDRLCEALGICDNSAAEVVPKPAENEVEVGTGVSAECILCELIMKEVVGLLKKNGTEKDIIDALEKVCSILPSELKKDCDDFILNNIDMMVEIILALGPEGVCQGLEVCKGTALSAAVSAPQKGMIDSSIECQICTYIVHELDVLIKRNATQKDIDNFFDNICKVLPTKYEKECEAFVAQYTKEILDLFGAIPPKEICSFLKICTSSKAPTQYKKAQVGTSVECEICEYMMDLLERFMLTNATETEIEHFLENVCLILPAHYRNECDAFIKTYIDEIFRLLKDLGPLKICKALGVCQTSRAQPQESTECFLCEMVMKEVDKLLNEPKSKEEIEEVLELACYLMPGTIRQECQDFVKEYAPQIIQLLLQFVSPQKVCNELKLCQSAAVVSKLPVPHTLGGPACGPCEMVVGQLQIILREGSTEREIENFLKTKVCSLMKGEGRAACISFVDKYIPEIIQVITTMTPEEVCGLLGLCGSDNAIKKMVYKAVNSTAECMICELIVKEIRTGLSQNATQVEIQKFLDMVCSKAPLSLFAKGCQAFIDDYTKPIIKYLLAEMDPDAICDFLKVCTPSIKTNVAVSKVNSGNLCVLCDVVVDMLEKQLESNKSLEEVTKLIENICILFPSPLNDQCRAFLDIYGPVLLKLLVNSELAPYEVCKDLRLCTSATFQDPRLKSKNSDECAECKAVVTLAEDYLKSHKNQILDDIAEICDLLPQADQQECKNVIEVYGSYVFDLILEEYLDPETLCKDFGFCNGSMLGNPSIKCSIGPTFWCASMDNAKLCNAVEHCRRHAWN